MKFGVIQVERFLGSLASRLLFSRLFLTRIVLLSDSAVLVFGFGPSFFGHIFATLRLPIVYACPKLCEEPTLYTGV